MSQALIWREPVINRHKAITATRLRVHAEDSAAAVAGLTELLDTWPNARSVFVGLSGIAPDLKLLEWTPPENVMIEIPAAAVDEPAVRELIAELHRRDVPLCLDGYTPGLKLPPGSEFRFLLADARLYPEFDDAPGLLLAKGLADQSEFDLATMRGYSGAAGWFFLHGMPVAEKLNPSHAQIVRVLSLVRRNADVREIEAALKQDVTLSFKLLRYINSAGFGLSCEIQSFRHAVTILGYDKLNKWLSLLLVTASKDPAAPALMQTAIARGRFMEIVGADFFDRNQLDNLFIVGAFSLLDVILGARMEAALDQMHLPEALMDGLLRHKGIYAPFLDLAIACESADIGQLRARAAAIGVPVATLNHAQIEALAFADLLQFS